MGKQFGAIFRANVDTATLRRKPLNGVNYLVGPVIMAKETVMNGIFYSANELKKSATLWNGRPVVVNHPKDADGNCISANEPAIVEKQGLGLIYNTVFDPDTTRLKAECWLDEVKLAANESITAVVAEGGMLEVSTGLFLCKIDQTGVYNGKDYTAIGVNYAPDHLAFLPGQTGACSVADGAGFPRMNELLTANEISTWERDNRIGKAVRKKFSQDGSFAYVLAIFETYLVFERWESDISGYQLYRVDYVFGTDEQTVTFGDTITPVVASTTYVDAVNEKGANNRVPAADADAGKGVQNMRKETIQQWVTAGLLDANHAATVEAMDDASFALISANMDAITAFKSAAAEQKTALDAANAKITGLEAQKPVPETNADWQKYAQTRYEADRQALITKITGNAQNQYTAEELASKPIAELQKIAAFVPNAADMTAAGGGAVAPTVKINAKIKPCSMPTTVGLGTGANKEDK